MLVHVSPCYHGRLVAPEGERQDLARLREAFESLDGDEAVVPVEKRAKRRGGIEVGLLAPFVGDGFEDHGNHGGTFSRKVLSPARINRFCCASAKFSRAAGSPLSRAR